MFFSIPGPDAFITSGCQHDARQMCCLKPLVFIQKQLLSSTPSIAVPLRNLSVLVSLRFLQLYLPTLPHCRMAQSFFNRRRIGSPKGEPHQCIGLLQMLQRRPMFIRMGSSLKHRVDLLRRPP